MQLKNLLLNNRLLGQLMFLVLFILAGMFYLERTLFVDPCYAVFNLTYFRDFVAEAGRHTAVIPQLPALLAIKVGLPLRIVLAVYSVSFILLYYVIYLVIAYGFKLDRLALAVPLILVTGVKYSFFWISTETHQALVYTILFYAFLTWSETLPRNLLTFLMRLIVGSGILLMAFYTHPIALFTVLFVLGFHVIEHRLWLRPDGYILGAVITALALVKYLTSSPTGYESTFFRGFADFFNRIGHLFASGSFQFMRMKLFNIYLLPMAIFFVTAIWYGRRKHYFRLAYYLVALGVFALILFTTFDIFYLPFIQEKNLMGLMLFLLIPFLRDVVTANRPKQAALQFFLVAAFVVGVGHVTMASAYYRTRMGYIREVVEAVRQFPEKKFIIPEPLVDRGRLGVNWALAPETLLLSSLDGPDSSVTVYINDNYGKLSDSTNLKDSLLFICAPWAKYLEVRKLDRRYFNLQNSYYKVLTEKDLVRGSDIALYDNRFDDPKFKAGEDSCRRDPTGNIYFVTKSEFSPGFYGKYDDVTKSPSILVSASIRVCPVEAVNPKWLNLVISRERNNVVYDYYMAGVVPADSLQPGRWSGIAVSGIVRRKDPGDQLKVYLWNPGKKAIAMDDLVVSYRVVNKW